jgi:CopG family transcriptional regulator, nickel-responsive regulator
MERITMSIDEDLAKAFDELIAARGYTSRSEAMRDLLRREVGERHALGSARTQCVASLSYVYNHHVRELSERLTAAQHAHHSLVVATTHVHLDHEYCLENMFLKGPTAAVRAFADGIRAERGVAYGQINLITVESGDEHRLSPAHQHRGHMHLTPRS